MINRVTLVGNLGKDPEVRHFENGGSVARLTVATNENYKDKDGNWQTQTEWHNVVAWRANAERAEKEMKKGTMVFVEGKLKTRSYKDANGIDRLITEVEANVIRSLERRERSDNYSGNLPPLNTYENPGVSTGGSSNSPAMGGGESIPQDDDLPF